MEVVIVTTTDKGRVGGQGEGLLKAESGWGTATSIPPLASQTLLVPLNLRAGLR